MEKQWIFALAIGLFILYTWVILVLGRRYVKKEYSAKAWSNWTMRLYNWQAAVFYSLILTAVTILVLKWTKVIAF